MMMKSKEMMVRLNKNSASLELKLTNSTLLQRMKRCPTSPSLKKNQKNRHPLMSLLHRLRSKNSRKKSLCKEAVDEVNGR